MRIVVAFVGFVFLFTGVLFFASNKTTEIISPLAKAYNMLTPTSTKTNDLSAVVEIAMQGTIGTYSIAIRNLKTGESYNKNEHTKFQTASLYKLWVMATVMSQLEKGDYTEDLVLSDSISELNRIFGISPEYAERTEGTVRYTVREAIEQMITISHNYASFLLTRRAKLANVRTFLSNHTLHESSPGEPPMTTASDIASFFEQLYRGRLAGTQKTNDMINILKRQKLNEKLPKLLPQKTSIAHKTGELDMVSHDAGIVFGTRGDYIIVVLSESNNPPAANIRIASLSRAVYEYFEKK